MIVFFEKKARVEFGTSDSSRCLDVVSCVVEEERAWCVRRFIAIPVFMFRPFAGFSGNRVSCVVNVLENTNLIDRVLGVVRARMEQPCKSPSFSAKAFYSPTFLFSVFFHFLSPLFSHVLSVSCSLSRHIMAKWCKKRQTCTPKSQTESHVPTKCDACDACDACVCVGRCTKRPQCGDVRAKMETSTPARLGCQRDACAPTPMTFCLKRTVAFNGNPFSAKSTRRFRSAGLYADPTCERQAAMGHGSNQTPIKAVRAYPRL